MLTRRKVLVSGLMAGASGVLRRAGVAHAAASQPRTKVSFDVPPGATDCAVHVFGDTKRHPYWEGRTYTPEPATVAELKQVMRALASRSCGRRAGVDVRNGQLVRGRQYPRARQRRARRCGDRREDDGGLARRDAPRGNPRHPSQSRQSGRPPIPPPPDSA